MDIGNHILAGAAAGSFFGHPVAGALCGALPDLVLGIKRRPAPTLAYNVTHSAAFAAFAAAAAYAYSGTNAGAAVGLALLSHLILDLPTHGKQWAPVLLYPLSNKRFSYGEEWEWFSYSWWGGFSVTIFWSGAWILGSLFHTGYL